MKTNKTSVFELLLYFLIVISSGIVLVFPITLDTWRNILFLLSLLLAVIFFISQKIPVKKMKKNFLLFLIVYFSILAIQSVLSVLRYNYSFAEFIYASRSYLWMIVVFPVFYLMIRRDNIDRFLLIINRISLISLVLRSFTWGLYKFAGIQMFKNLLFEYGVLWSRTGSIRIDATPMNGILLVSLYYFYDKTKSKIYLIELFLVFLYLFFVTQTRTLLLGSLITIFGMMILKKRRKDVSAFIFVTVLILLLITFYVGGFDKLLNYLDLNTGVQGLGYRYYEFNYFSNLLKFGNWKWGLGILSTQNDFTRAILFGNLETPMYIDDLGIFGSFVQFGLTSILVYLSLFVCLFLIKRKCAKKGFIQYELLITGFLIYLMVVSIPLDAFGIQRSFSLPIILAISGYIENSINVKENENELVIYNKK